MKHSKAELSIFYFLLPIGENNAITRLELSMRWGVPDRQARRIIHELRASDNGDNMVIISSSHSKRGYFKTDDITVIARFRNEIYSRALNTFAPLKKIDRILWYDADQLELTEGQKDILNIEWGENGGEVIEKQLNDFMYQCIGGKKI